MSDTHSYVITTCSTKSVEADDRRHRVDSRQSIRRYLLSAVQPISLMCLLPRVRFPPPRFIVYSLETMNSSNRRQPRFVIEITSRSEEKEFRLFVVSCAEVLFCFEAQRPEGFCGVLALTVVVMAVMMVGVLVILSV